MEDIVSLLFKIFVIVVVVVVFPKPYTTDRSSSIFNLSGKRFFTISNGVLNLGLCSQILGYGKLPKSQKEDAFSVPFCLF